MKPTNPHKNSHTTGQCTVLLASLFVGVLSACGFLASCAGVWSGFLRAVHATGPMETLSGGLLTMFCGFAAIFCGSLCYAVFTN